MAKFEQVFDEWAGRPYVDWCAEDPDDEREIRYTLHVHYWNDVWEKKQYKSSDKVDFFTLQMIRMSEIRSIRLMGDVWYADLEYYAVA